MRTAIDLLGACEHLTELWSPRVVAALNDMRVKVAEVAGEFVWHDHQETDELFLVLSGRLVIRFRDGAVELRPGELYVVPRGVEHCPVADEGTKILLIEPAGVVNTGAVTAPQTAPVDAPLDGDPARATRRGTA